MHLKNPIALSYDYDTVPSSPVNAGLRVTLPDIAELQRLPASGTITFRYTRENLNLRKDDTLSAEICLCELLEVDGDKEAEEKQEDVVDKLFAEAKEKPKDDEEKE